ncbi:MAG: leucine-rich repeat protein [Clostridia bacterium]|nr:leucine-rich repeat protein [Clostridia bacterium]
MKSKKFLSVIMCFALIACMLPYASLSAFADDEIHTSADGNWKYRILDDNTAEIYGGEETLAYYGNEIAINIPGHIDGVTVTQIGDFAFSGLEIININAGIRQISSLAFAMCSELTQINVDSNNSYFCSVNGILFDKNMELLICYPAGKTDSSYTIPSGVQNIGMYSFFACIYLSEITLSDTVKDIGLMSFGACASLSVVNMTSALSDIEEYAFYGCESLTELAIPASTTVGDYAFADSGLTTIKGYWDTEAERFANDNGYAFVSLDILGDIDYDGSVTLDDYAVIKTHLIDDTLNFKKVADYNTDGAIDAFDLFYIDLAVNQQDA